MSQNNNINSSLGTVEQEYVFGAHSDSDFGPISADPVISFGGTAYRWVTQLTVNDEKYGSAEGAAVKQNLIVEQGEYINSVKAGRLFGAYNFITQIKFTTNRGKTWVLEGRESPEKTREKHDTMELNNIRLLGISGSYGGLGNSLKQLKIRYLDNYFVEDQPEDTGAKKLFAILNITGQGTIEYYESTEVRNLESITAINEITASVETQVTQSYLLAEATSRLGLSYMNRQELRTEKERVEKVSKKVTIDVQKGQFGVGMCQVEVKKLKLSENGEERYLLVPVSGKVIYPIDVEQIKKMRFFDLSSNLQFFMPDLKYVEKYGWDTFHKAEES